MQQARAEANTERLPLLTSSRLRVFRDQCRRKHKLMYVDGWRPVKPAEALRFGSMVHLALAAWWIAKSNRLELALAAIAGASTDPYEQARAEELMRGYDARWDGAMSAFKILAVEEPFYGPLVNPETWASSKTFQIAGKVDAIVRELATGDIVLVEHKTASDALEDPTSSYWLKLAMDGQVSHYYIGSESLGFPVTKCIYDVIHKPGLKPLKATPEESRKFKKDGTLYANQRDRDESPEEYRERLRADIAERPDHYFQRRPVPRTESDLREYMADTWALARSMREDELAGRAPRNPDSCHRFGECDFWEHCAFGIRLEDRPGKYRRLDHMHPELQELAP